VKASAEAESADTKTAAPAKAAGKAKPAAGKTTKKETK
jgi:hypothetical protein